jgi:hypothetical protein
MAAEPVVGPWPIFQFLDPVHSIQSVGLLALIISPSQGLSAYTQNKRTQYRYPCLEWDSNPRTQCSSDHATTVIGTFVVCIVIFRYGNNIVPQ